MPPAHTVTKTRRKEMRKSREWDEKKTSSRVTVKMRNYGMSIKERRLGKGNKVV